MSQHAVQVNGAKEQPYFALLPPATQKVYQHLQSKAQPDSKAITLTRAEYLHLCHCKNIQAADRHLTRLKKAGLLAYTTSQATIAVQFTAHSATAQPTGTADPCITRAAFEHLQHQIAELRELVRQLTAQLANQATGAPATASPAKVDPSARQAPTPRAPTRRSRAKQASLYMGSNQKGGQTAGGIPPKPGNARHVAIAKALLEECGLLQDVQVFAETIPLEELRAIATRWRTDPGTRTGGSLRYRILNRHKPEWAQQTKPLTMTEYLTPFVQRYRTPEELARDDQLFAVPVQLAPEPNRAPASETPRSAEPSPLSGESLTAKPASPEHTGERNSLPCPVAYQVKQATPTVEADPKAHALWQAVLEELSLALPQAAYNTWVKGAYIVSHEEGAGQSHWIIGVPNAYALDWLRSRLAQRIQRALASLTQQTVQLEFR